MAKETENKEIAKAQGGDKPAKKTSKFMSGVQKTMKYLRDCKGEIKKIIWPKPNMVFKNMGVVLITVAVSGVIVFALDTVFLNLLSLVMEIAK